MTILEKLNYLKEVHGISKAFVSRVIGTTPDRLYKFTRPKEHKLYKNLRPEQIKKLNEYLSGFDFPQA